MTWKWCQSPSHTEIQRCLRDSRVHFLPVTTHISQIQCKPQYINHRPETKYGQTFGKIFRKMQPFRRQDKCFQKGWVKKSPEKLNCMLQFQGGRRRRKWVIRDHSKSNLIHYSLRSRRSMAIMWQQLLADKFNSQPLALTLRAVNPPLKAKYVCLGLIQAQKWLLWANQSPAETEF